MESKERTIYDRKQKIKEAIERKSLKSAYRYTNILTKSVFLIEGKKVPTELRDMDKAGKEDLGYDQAQEGI